MMSLKKPSDQETLKDGTASGSPVVQIAMAFPLVAVVAPV